MTSMANKEIMTRQDIVVKYLSTRNTSSFVTGVIPEVAVELYNWCQ